MSRRKTKPDEIRNPEHYFNKYIAKEVLHDNMQTEGYQEMHRSLETILLGEDPFVSSKSLLSITYSDDTHLLRSHEYNSVADWLADIEDAGLFHALSMLNYRQQLILLYRYDYLLSQCEVADMLHISQQAVSKLERSAKKEIKKFLQKGCKKP